MTQGGILNQLVQMLLVVLAAPLLVGWVNACRAWLQNKSAPSLLQPYRLLRKLLHKDAALAENASWLFRFAPYVIFGCMWLVAGIVPVVASELPFAAAADVIALVGVFAVARVFISLAAMDIGTAFGTLGARREMLIGALAEPALLIIFFNFALISQSTSLTTIVDTLAHREFALYPSLAFAAVAFVMVLLAENARVPVDNPATHLELTMVHEAMVLEYSGRHLALIDLASELKLLLYVSVIGCLFTPWGIAPPNGTAAEIAVGFATYIAKLAVGGVLLAVFETSIAKMRVFRVPAFLGAALMLGLLATLLLFVSRSL